MLFNKKHMATRKPPPVRLKEFELGTAQFLALLLGIQLGRPGTPRSGPEGDRFFFFVTFLDVIYFA